MKVEKSRVLGLSIIVPDVFEDCRGEYVETWNKRDYEHFGVEWVQDDISVSTHNVFRGLHGDDRTWKLVSCLHGRIMLAVVDEHIKRGETIILSDKNRKQVLIPPKYANGHLVLSSEAIFHYKQSTYYEGAGKQFTLRLSNPKVAKLVKLPSKSLILSERDS